MPDGGDGVKVVEAPALRLKRSILGYFLSDPETRSQSLAFDKYARDLSRNFSSLSVGAGVEASETSMK